MHSMAERVAGKGLVWAEGDEHKRQRLMLNPVFNHDQIRSSEEEIRRAANR